MTNLDFDCSLRPKYATGRRRECRTGLTLVELLCALALATLLMVSVLSLTRVVAARSKQLASLESAETWQLRLEEQLRAELQVARRFEQTPTELRLLGYAARDFRTGESTQRPVEIRYQIQPQEDGTSWLRRREVHLDELSNGGWREETVCAGVTRIEMRLPFEQKLEASHAGKIPPELTLSMFNDKQAVLSVRHFE